MSGQAKRGDGFVCHGVKTVVVESRPWPKGVWRRRRCKKCKQTFWTIEILLSKVSTDPKFDYLFERMEK